jgi:EAL domain-containing protein (putative c-di-GMP-specific phosphodiesterase class I)
MHVRRDAAGGGDRDDGPKNGYDCIAEGVETGSVVRAASDERDEMQGFYSSAPIPSDDFTQLLCRATREPERKEES